MKCESMLHAVIMNLYVIVCKRMWNCNCSGHGIHRENMYFAKNVCLQLWRNYCELSKNAHLECWNRESVETIKQQLVQKRYV